MKLNSSIRHMLRFVPVLLGATVLTFFLINLLPGDPAAAMLGDQATPEQVATLRAELGLDQPVLLRYADWLTSALRGDLARSLLTGQPVAEAVTQRLPVSFQLMIMAQVIALVVAIPLGVLAAWRRDGLFDRVVSAFSYALLSTPGYVLAIVLIYAVSVTLAWLPAAGFTSLMSDPIANLRSMLLPSLVLGAPLAAIYIRCVRSEMIAALQEDFVLLAKAQGHSIGYILFRQALRPSLLPLLTVLGLSAGGLIGGAVIIESLFALPGLGSLMIESILNRDYPVLQGVVLCTAVAFCVVNLLVELAYLLLDPRIRHE